MPFANKILVFLSKKFTFGLMEKNRAFYYWTPNELYDKT